ncbi:MAG: 30S ribosomal protein S1 [Candidatus Eutrophobiaceae bacterium]
MSESFAELFEASYLQAPAAKPGNIITATVMDIVGNNVIVNAGLKSEAYIPRNQFKGEEVNIQDQIDVVLEMIEDGYGETHLSREKAIRIRAWEKLGTAHEQEEIVSGQVTERIKGGFSVEIMGLRAFLPGSLVDIRPMRDGASLENKSIDVKIIKIDRERDNIVISRRAVIESEDLHGHKQLLESLKEGAIVKGIVKNLTDYGAFLDLGGIDGLLHITDIAWKRLQHPSELLTVGDEIDVKVLKFDRERNRVSLGLKQMGEDPWENLAQHFPENTRLKGRVTNLVEYGCFVELETGVEGLVHVSEMDWTNKNVHPSKLVQISQEVDVMILGIDEGRRRISLGMKQCTPNPWEQFSSQYSKNSRISGVIKSITDFGIFVGLPEGVDGLVHTSDISWENCEAELLKYQKGINIEVLVLSVDAERERISLGIKQLRQDPFSDYIAKYSKGSLVKATVAEVSARSVQVNLAEEVTGLLRASELFLSEKVEDARAHVKEGDELEVKIITADRKKRHITVSVKARLLEEETNAARDYAPSASGGAKLGDFMKPSSQDDSAPEDEKEDSDGKIID